MQAGSPDAIALEPKLLAPLTREYSLLDLLKRPELSYADLASMKGQPLDDREVSEQVEILAKYSGYIDRQQDDIDRLRTSQAMLIPAEFDYSVVEGLSNEMKQKLNDIRPDSIARAGRIPGVTPAAISLLLITLKKRGLLKRTAVRR